MMSSRLPISDCQGEKPEAECPADEKDEAEKDEAKGPADSVELADPGAGMEEEAEEEGEEETGDGADGDFVVDDANDVD